VLRRGFFSRIKRPNLAKWVAKPKSGSSWCQGKDIKTLCRIAKKGAFLSKNAVGQKSISEVR
jgi:hypothetical protein